MATVLAIETSCDETAVAVVKNRQVCSSIIASQIPVHQQYGGVVPEVASRQHLETINGAIAQALEQAQVDWGYFGEIYDKELNKTIKVYGFFMILGYSRMKYVEFFTNQNTKSFLKGHNNALTGFPPQNLMILRPKPDQPLIFMTGLTNQYHNRLT